MTTACAILGTLPILALQPCRADLTRVVSAPIFVAQISPLNGDVKRLKVRHLTDHYALSGTVSDARFIEYGHALEYIYKEYAKGFETLIGESDKPNLRNPRNQSSRSKQKNQRASPSQSRNWNRDGSGSKSPNTTGGNGKAAAHSVGVDTEKGHGHEHRFRVVILSIDQEYKEFCARYFSGWTEHTRGLFVPSAELLLIRDEAISEKTYEILFHEAFHQFLHRYIPLTPTWANEGLATYYGTARVTPNGLVFDRPGSGYFQIVRDTVLARKLIPFDELMVATPGRFYSHAPIEGISVSWTTLAYGQSYTLVAYMLSGTGGIEHLQAYLRQLAKAPSHNDVQRITRQSFPPEIIDRLIPEWLAYVNRH